MSRQIIQMAGVRKRPSTPPRFPARLEGKVRNRGIKPQRKKGF